jgi:hypothetical protein
MKKKSWLNLFYLSAHSIFPSSYPLFLLLFDKAYYSSSALPYRKIHCKRKLDRAGNYISIAIGLFILTASWLTATQGFIMSKQALLKILAAPIQSSHCVAVSHEAVRIKSGLFILTASWLTATQWLLWIGAASILSNACLLIIFTFAMNFIFGMKNKLINFIFQLIAFFLHLILCF